MPKNPILISLFTAVVALVGVAIVVGRRAPVLPPADVAMQTGGLAGPDGTGNPEAYQIPTLPPLPTARPDAPKGKQVSGSRVEVPPEPTPKTFAENWAYRNAIGNIVEMDFGHQTVLRVEKDVPFLSPEGEKGTVVEIRPFQRIVVVKRDTDGQLFEIPKAVIEEATGEPDPDAILDKYEEVVASMDDQERDEFQKGMDALNKYGQDADKANQIQEYESKLLEYERMKTLVAEEKKNLMLKRLSALRNSILMGGGEANETPFDTKTLDSMTPEQRRTFLQRLNTLQEIQRKVSQ